MISQKQLENLKPVVRKIACQIAEENPSMLDSEIERLAKDIVIMMVAREKREGNI